MGACDNKVKLTPVICPYCGAGCGLYIKSVEGNYAGVEYWTDHPVNKGALCPKPNDLSWIRSKDRLTTPLKRTESGFKPISWSEALKTIATNLREIVRRDGPDALGFLASARTFNEEVYVVQKLARVLGTNNIDHCARLCHAPTLVGMANITGAGALTATMEDITGSDVVVIWGYNPAATHPVLMGRYILKAKLKGARIIVVDPRYSETARKADLWLPVKPGGDVALANAIMHVLIKENLVDKEFVAERVDGYDKLVEVVEKYTPEYAEEVAGVPAAKIVEAARIIGNADKGSILWCMGITQQTKGTRIVYTLATIAALRGWYGKPDCCVGGTRGQNNVQGACDMGALATFLPGYVKVTDDDGRKRIADTWGVPGLPEEPGHTVIEMSYAAEHGKLKALYIVGENPVISDANANHVKKALQNLDFLVVQDILMTETAEYADIILPAAAWAEKEGSFTNLERKVQWSFKALEPPGQAISDLEIIVKLAKELELERYFPYRSPDDVLREINKVVPQYAGITPERLKKPGVGIYWPCPSPDSPGTRILHVDRFRTPNGKFQVIPAEHTPPAEEPDNEYPYLLTTVRYVGMYHTATMTGRSQSLEKRWPEAEAWIHPSVAENLGIKTGDKVKLVTRRGEYVAVANVTPLIREDTVSVAWHFGANVLTNDALDPEAKIPETKVCAVKIVPLGKEVTH